MKTILMVGAALLLITWAVMFFVLKTGAVAHILLTLAGIIVLFRYSLDKVLS
jgi:hypothetical protein